MKNLKMFEEFEYDNEKKDSTPPLLKKYYGKEDPKATTQKLKESYEKNGRLEFKFEKPIGGLSTVTFVKGDGFPRVQESLVSLIKALKAVWNKAKDTFREIKKWVCEKLGMGMDKVNAWFNRIFKMNDNEISSIANTTESKIGQLFIVGVIIGISLVILGPSLSPGSANLVDGEWLPMAQYSTTTWVSIITGALLAVGSVVGVTKSKWE